MLCAVLALTSCGEDSKHFKIEGRLLNMNQGEFYIYSEDGDIQGIDTIQVQGGRFSKDISCEEPMTLVLVFPNFSQQPIFAEPGKTLEIDGDATHLKAMKVKGTKDNELMGKFREQTANFSPPETRKQASLFIADHPQSPVSIYLLKQLFVNTPTPDYKEGYRLAQILLKAQPNNGKAVSLAGRLRALAGTTTGSTLPSFSVTDLNGSTVTSAQFASGLSVIFTWALWNYNSTDMMRQLRQKQTSGDKDFKVMAVSVDAGKTDVRNYLKSYPVPWTIVCTGEMVDTPLLRQLGLQAVPANLVLKNGRIIARNLSTQDLLKQIDSL